jgi:hypothetical protein
MFLARVALLGKPSPSPFFGKSHKTHVEFGLSSFDVLVEGSIHREIPLDSPANATRVEDTQRQLSTGEATMRVLVFVKANQESETGVMPSTEELAEMGVYNEELVKAGVMLAGEGLHPSSRGVRIYFDGQERKIVDGPFTEAKELVAGFWIWQVKSMEEAVEWAKRSPFQAGQLELRPVFEADDFGEALTPELREQEERLRGQLGSSTQP